VPVAVRPAQADIRRSRMTQIDLNSVPLIVL